MRACPACRAPLEAQFVLDVEVDVCPRCNGVFLDPGDAEGRGWDLAALFGAGTASLLGTSTRPCAVHERLMERWLIGEGLRALEIERASCCGGVFLDANEGRAFADAAAHATQIAAQAGLATRGAAAATETAADGTIRTDSGAVFAAPPPPPSAPKPSTASDARRGAFATVARNVVATSGTSAFRSSSPPYVVAAGAKTDRACPRCGALMAADRGDGIEIDVCPSCEATFLDLSSFDARGLDTGVLFGMGPEAAVNRGSSDLACPRCNELMLVFDVPTIAGPLEVERAPCCGGLFLDGGEREPFVRAARRAIQDAADRTFAEQGEVVGEAAMTKSLAESGALTQMMLASIRARVDGMMLRMIEQAKRRHHHHHYHH